MGDLRQIVATDLIHGLLRQNAVGEVGETSADRIAALGLSDKTHQHLGTLLWRLRWANEHRAFEPAVKVLVELCRPRRWREVELRPHAEAICRLALEEWLDDICRKCGGRGHTINKGVKHACAKCNATGTRRHSDMERMRRLKLDRRLYRLAERRFSEVHMKIGDADIQTARDTAQQLERGRH